VFCEDCVEGDAGEVSGAIGMKTFFGLVGPELVEGGGGEGPVFSWNGGFFGD
jgi:hypothetical protein